MYHESRACQKKFQLNRTTEQSPIGSLMNLSQLSKNSVFLLPLSRLLLFYKNLLLLAATKAAFYSSLGLTFWAFATKEWPGPTWFSRIDLAHQGEENGRLVVKDYTSDGGSLIFHWLRDWMEGLEQCPWSPKAWRTAL